jgi:peptide/nickel transport system permease protein
MTEIAIPRTERSGFWTSVRRLRSYSRLMIGGGMIVLIVLIAIFGPMIWPHSSTDLVGDPLARSTGAHPFGTDELGRDELARVILGARVSLLVAAVAIAIGFAGGATIGLAAGHHGGKIDAVLMRFIDGLQAFPALLLAVMIAAALGPGLFNAMVAVGIAIIPAFARLARSQALRIRHQDYIDAARLGGQREIWIILRHVVPNSISPMIVFAATTTAQAILAEAALAFLGLGAAPPTPDWGAMLHSGYGYITINPWLTVYPGAAIAITTLAFVFLGDGLRDWLDPRSAD